MILRKGKNDVLQQLTKANLGAHCVEIHVIIIIRVPFNLPVQVRRIVVFPDVAAVPDAAGAASVECERWLRLANCM